MIGLAVTGAVLFDMWWMFGQTLFPVFQWALLSPAHRAQVLGRERPSS